MDQQQRNLFIAIALSLAILFVLPVLLGAHPNSNSRSSRRNSKRSLAGRPARRSPGPAGVVRGAAQPAPSRAAPGMPAAAQPASRRARKCSPPSPRVAIATPRLNGSIDLTGARLDDLTLANYRETTDPDSPRSCCWRQTARQHPYFVAIRLGPEPIPRSRCRDRIRAGAQRRGALTPDHPVDLTWDNGEGLIFTRHIAVDADYMFTVTDSVTSHEPGAAPVDAPSLRARVARRARSANSSTYLLHEGPVGVFNGTLKDGIKYATLKDEPRRISRPPAAGSASPTNTGCRRLIPTRRRRSTARFAPCRARPAPMLYQVDYPAPSMPQRSSPAQSRQRPRAASSPAPRRWRCSTATRSQAGMPRFDRAIDFGWFYFLTKPIFLALDFFYKLLGNFGLAIMLLTVLIKLLFFPLANKSYRAMSKMKLLQPEMTEAARALRRRQGSAQPGDDGALQARRRQPVAGCLPIVIQIPVFFSLYKVLYVTIEMRQAPFYGWIHDLSAPDPTSFVNLFGLLPFAPPAFLVSLHIGAWPLIMGVHHVPAAEAQPAAARSDAGARCS